MNSNDVNSENDIRTKAILKSAATIAVFVFVGLWGFKLYKGYEVGKKGDAVHQDYIENCQVFLQNAVLAGTVDTSRSELEKAENWLKTNYNRDSFEYKDLKADLNYLGQQRPTLILPASIAKSIQHSGQLVDEIEVQKHDQSWSEFLNLFFLPIMIPTGLISLLGILIETGVLEKKVNHESRN